MSSQVVGLLGFAALLLLLSLRVKVAIAMLLVGLVGYAHLATPQAALARIGADAFGEAASYSLSVIPLFVLMGLVLASCGLGQDLYAAFDVVFSRVRGGLGVATVGASSLFGAVSGSAIASATTMSLVAIPEMRRHDYDDGYSAACTAVGGTLGALIPPSAILVLYGILTEEPIGAILIAGIVPGAMTALILMLTAYLIVLRRPSLAPNVKEERPSNPVRTLVAVWPVIVIFGTSMGGLYYGFFTPTEAGGAGAVLALIYGLLSRRLDRKGFSEAVSRTIRTSAMIFLLVIAGKFFGFFLSLSGLPRAIGQWVSEAPLAPAMLIGLIFLVYFVMGAFMDEIAIMVIMTPMFYPVVLELGYSGVWFGVLTIMMLLTGLLTPPVGMISFVVSGITKIDLGRIFRSVTPFWVALAVSIALVIIWPQIVLFLPALMGR